MKGPCTYVLKINTIFILQGMKKNQESLYTVFKYRQGKKNGNKWKLDDNEVFNRGVSLCTKEIAF